MADGDTEGIGDWRPATDTEVAGLPLDVLAKHKRKPGTFRHGQHWVVCATCVPVAGRGRKPTKEVMAWVPKPPPDTTDAVTTMTASLKAHFVAVHAGRRPSAPPPAPVGDLSASAPVATPPIAGAADPTVGPAGNAPPKDFFARYRDAKQAAAGGGGDAPT